MTAPATPRTDSESWRRIEELCQAALDRAPQERGAFLAAACAGDDVLRHEVEALLTHAPTADAFLDVPLGAVAAQAMGGGTGQSLVGRTIGSYNVLAAIGAGGMGEVYRARDSKLGRDVAIKVLPAAFTADRDRLARFEREARVLASLNHPNIAAIYGLEQVGDVRALVLELVEGETLAERIGNRDSGLGIGQSLSIVRQIAEALEAAHEKGIVHRDLKPANIKVTPGGTVKVLDFGLAKSDAGSAPDLSHSPTITITGTRDGVLLGTAAYMSPEQARGQSVDKRADIWAFGCVLFEMLTGQMPFPGDTVSDHIAAILEREPDWNAVPRATPSAIRRLLRRCLEKDPKRRLHDIADARIEIDESLAAPSASSAPIERPGPSARIAWSAAGVALAALAALAGWSIWTGAPHDSSTARTSTRFVIQPPADAPFGAGFDISPDGIQVAYVGGNGPFRMYMRRLDQFDATPIAGTNGIFRPFFSPDGEWVAFSRLGNKLEKISLKAAAAPVALFDSGKDPILGAHWATDGTILIATREHGLRRVSAEGGDASVVTTLSKDSLEICHHNPVLLPGGRAVLFTVHEGVEQFSVAVQSLVSGERKVLIKSGFDAQYSPSGHLVFANGSAILAVPFDVPGLKVTGPAVTLVENVATAPNDGYGNFRISQSGSLVYEAAQAITGRVLIWVDRSGAETPLPISPRAYSNPRLSPDGKRLALAVQDGDRQDIWIYEIASDRLMRLTTEGINQAPLWTRDGTWLTYSSIRGTTKAVQRLLHQPADGSQQPEMLLERTSKVHPGDWTPDGSVRGQG